MRRRKEPMEMGLREQVEEIKETLVDLGLVATEDNPTGIINPTVLEQSIDSEKPRIPGGFGRDPEAKREPKVRFVKGFGPDPAKHGKRLPY